MEGLLFVLGDMVWWEESTSHLSRTSSGALQYRENITMLVQKGSLHTTGATDLVGDTCDTQQPLNTGCTCTFQSSSSFGCHCWFFRLSRLQKHSHFFCYHFYLPTQLALVFVAGNLATFTPSQLAQKKGTRGRGTCLPRAALLWAKIICFDLRVVKMV